MGGWQSLLLLHYKMMKFKNFLISKNGKKITKIGNRINQKAFEFNANYSEILHALYRCRMIIMKEMNTRWA